MTTIKKENKETRATICKENIETRKTLQKLAQEFPNMFVETKNNEACESLLFKKINEWTSQIVNLFAYKTKLQQHLHKTDTEVINTKKRMNSFWYQKHKAWKAVFFNQIEIENSLKYSVKNYKRKRQTFHANFSQLSDYEKEEEIKLELVKDKGKVQLKLQDIYSRKQLETIKKIDRNKKLCGRTPFQRTSRKFIKTLGTRIQIN